MSMKWRIICLAVLLSAGGPWAYMPLQEVYAASSSESQIAENHYQQGNSLMSQGKSDLAAADFQAEKNL